MSDDAVASARKVYRAGAVSNFVVSAPAFIAYDRTVAMLADEPPRYRFLVRIWAGMAILWGVMFWEISRDPASRLPMLKYTWLEKMVTSGAVWAAARSHEVPGRFMVSIVVTDVIWIPAFMVLHWRLRRNGGR